MPTVVVVVNLRLVQEMHDDRLSVPRDFEAIWTAFSCMRSTDTPSLICWPAICPGAAPIRSPGESASDACAIRRENAVRAELGLGRRADHGLYSLALAMRYDSARSVVSRS